MSGDHGRLARQTLSDPMSDPCSIPAQAVHRFETRVTRSAEGKTGRVFVGDLSDENAMDLAGKLVSEFFVYTVCDALSLLNLMRIAGVTANVEPRLLPSSACHPVFAHDQPVSYCSPLCLHVSACARMQS